MVPTSPFDSSFAIATSAICCAALARLFERWGIAEQIKDRIVTAPPGVPVGSLVANGTVALGFQQLSELIHVEGIAIVGR